ncbi:MAG: alpha-xylosidase [Bacilli bacterium]|nr:alpha-xylosidase [Bacilli bacterium]
MKFANGEWLLQKGVEIFSPKEVYFEKLIGNKLILTAPTQYIRHRGDTLGGVLLTIEISTPFAEVIRVKTYHHKGIRDGKVDFELNLPEKPIDYTSDDEEIIVRSGSLKLVINKKNWFMSYYRGEELLTKSLNRDLGYVKKDWAGLAYDKPTYDNSFMQQRLSLGVGDCVYGLGERFTAFVKNGQTVEIWNQDAGTSSDQSYINIPFYLTNRGYGVFVNHPERVSFEVASENVKKVGFAVHGEALDYFFFNGPSMKEVLVRYTDLTGKPGMPKPWSFGLWLSTSFTTSYDETFVLEAIQGMIARDIPLKVFHFDCFWMKDFHWSNLLWDERVFKDPEGLLKKIKALEIKVGVWINPYIAQESHLFDEGKEKGYLLKRPNGDVWQWDMWQPGMAIVDYTNPEAAKWYQAKLSVLIDMGVDAFKTDFGERLPVDVVYYNGADPYKMHNYYSYLYNKVVYELLEAKKGKGEAILFARSGTVGSQKYPVHWGGDCWSDYESMAESLRGGLSLSLSGFGFWSHDIGGFESSSSADVYKRWCAFGLLSSHSRLHGSTSYRVPWAYDEEAVAVLRHYTKLKNTLMPYLYSLAVEANILGIPSMRSLVLEFSEDKNTHYLDKQYLLGEALLVAPILNPQGLGECYLPKGKWTDLQTKAEYQGNCWYEQKYNYFGLPLFVKENTILPIGNIDNDCEYDYEDNLNLEVYSLVENKEVKRTVYSQDRKEAVLVSILKKDKQIDVKLKASKPLKIKFINLIVESAEFTVLVEGNHSLIEINNPSQVKELTLRI